MVVNGIAFEQEAVVHIEFHIAGVLAVVIVQDTGKMIVCRGGIVAVVDAVEVRIHLSGVAGCPEDLDGSVIGIGHSALAGLGHQGIQVDGAGGDVAFQLFNIGNFIAVGVHGASFVGQLIQAHRQRHRAVQVDPDAVTGTACIDRFGQRHQLGLEIAVQVQELTAGTFAQSTVFALQLRGSRHGAGDSRIAQQLQLGLQRGDAVAVVHLVGGIGDQHEQLTGGTAHIHQTGGLQSVHHTLLLVTAGAQLQSGQGLAEGGSIVEPVGGSILMYPGGVLTVHHQILIGHQTQGCGNAVALQSLDEGVDIVADGGDLVTHGAGGIDDEHDIRLGGSTGSSVDLVHLPHRSAGDGLGMAHLLQQGLDIHHEVGTLAADGGGHRIGFRIQLGIQVFHSAVLMILTDQIGVGLTVIKGSGGAVTEGKLHDLVTGIRGDQLHRLTHQGTAVVEPVGLCPPDHRMGIDVAGGIHRQRRPGVAALVQQTLGDIFIVQGLDKFPLGVRGHAVALLRQGIQAQDDLVAVGQTVTVGVGAGGIGEIHIHFLTVGKTVVIRVRLVQIGAAAQFVGIGQTVLVVILVGVVDAVFIGIQLIGVGAQNVDLGIVVQAVAVGIPFIGADLIQLLQNGMDVTVLQGHRIFRRHRIFDPAAEGHRFSIHGHGLIKGHGGGFGRCLPRQQCQQHGSAQQQRQSLHRLLPVQKQHHAEDRSGRQNGSQQNPHSGTDTISQIHSLHHRQAYLHGCGAGQTGSQIQSLRGFPAKLIALGQQRLHPDIIHCIGVGIGHRHRKSDLFSGSIGSLIRQQ